MTSGLRGRLFFAAGLVTALCSMGGASVAAGPDDTTTLGQSIVIARLNEIKVIGDLMREQTWPEFDPLAVPAIIYEPGGWAFAIGFAKQPAGFSAVEGVKHGDRPLYRAASGSFSHRGRSPANIEGTWAVISTFDPPRTLPSGPRTGREAGEVGLGRYVGDAFAIFLMQKRGRTTPFATEGAAYPESAELMALTTLEQRSITPPLQMAMLNENNIAEFNRMVQSVVAIRHARWKLMGEEIAAIERDIELTDGLRLFTETMVHRFALNKALVSTEPGGNDGTFVGWLNGGAMRMFGLGYPMFFTVDNPAFTLPQVATRGAVLGALLDKTAGPWRPRGMTGDLALIEILAQSKKVEPQVEADLLTEAKEAHHYDAILKLAQDDLAHLLTDRAAWIRRNLTPGPGLVEITLPPGSSESTSFEDDPWTTGHLGEGRLTHPGGLTLKATGLTLEAAATEGPGLVMTESGARRDAVRRILLAIPPGGDLKQGGKALKASEKPRLISDMEPLILDAAGLKLKVTSGSIVARKDGSLQVTMAH